MTEKRAKPVTKKVTTTKAGNAVASKPKTTKAGVATAAKKAATPAVKKAPEKKIPATQTSTIKAKPAVTQKTVTKPTPEERYRMVETTAYFIAERNGFQGDSTEHWAAAEREIAAKLGQ